LLSFGTGCRLGGHALDLVMKRAAPGQTGSPPSLDDIKACIEKRLFIGRVPAGTDDDDLREVFEYYGPLTECRLLRQKGVAFLTFETWAAAHQALINTDGQSCLRSHGSRDPPLVVSFAERSRNQSDRGKYAKGLEHSRVYVGGLPARVSEEDFRQMLENFGHVETMTLLAPKASYRSGFATFSIAGEALDAIEALDGQPGPDTEELMTVTLASPRDRGDVIPSSLKRRRVESSAPTASIEADFGSLKMAYLAAVSGDASDEVCNELHAKVMAARPSQRHRSSRDHRASPSRGEEGRDAPQEDRDSNRLFVGGLPHECSNEELRVLIDQIAMDDLDPSMCKVLECRVLPGRCCGYVKYSSREAAEEAIEALDDRAVSGWKQPLRVRWATPKGGARGASRPGMPPTKQDPELAQLIAESKKNPNLSVVGSALQALLAGDSAAAVKQLTSDRGATQLAKAAASVGSTGNQGPGTEASIRKEGLDPCRLFVGQLCRGCKDKSVLAGYFEPFGAIESLRILPDKSVAYVHYADFSSAKAAVAALSGRHFPGVSKEPGLHVSFSKLR